MRNENLLVRFSQMTYSEQQLFIQQLRRGRTVPSTNNVVKERKVKRKAEADTASLINSLTPDQIAQLIEKLGG